MSNIFGYYDTQDLNRKSAIDIQEKLRPIRQGINKDFIARRLIWELIQNAKDNVAVCNAGSDQSLKVEITLENDKFTFTHNKGFFKNENIRGLIRRYSSSDKDRNLSAVVEPPSTTGRFGTGFMTTHLLSEKVDVQGIFQKSEGAFKNFELILDRTGQNLPELIAGIEKSFESAEISINASQPVENSIENFKSNFVYHLDNNGILLTKIAIDELKYTAAYTLISHPNIKEIICKSDTESFNFSVKTIINETIDDIEIGIHELYSNNDSERKHYVSLSKSETKIIFPIKVKDNTFSFLPIEKEIPKLFLDFPMIGTEDLHFPFVINSPFFEPTESRDGISLTGGDDSDTKTNNSIIDEAFELYKSFLSYVEERLEWRDLYHLAKIKKPKEKDWLNLSWYEANYLKPIRTILLKKKLVDSNNGERKSIQDAEGKNQIYFPFASDEKVRDTIWDLSNELYPESLPCKEHTQEWQQIIWADCYKQTLEGLTIDIQEKLNIEALGKKLNKNLDETINWLNSYYDLLNYEGKLIDEIIKDKYGVIPNQLGRFCKRAELFIDQEIEEELKNVLAILDVNIKDKLRDRRINTKSNYATENKGQILYTIKTQDSVIEDINKIIIEGKNEKITTACDFLISILNEEPGFPAEQQKIFDFCSAIWEMPERKSLIIWKPSIWIEVNKLQVKWIIEIITGCSNVDKLQATLKIEKHETISWLNTFVAYLLESGRESQLNLKTAPILPNQNGKFCLKDNLFLDDGTIDESIKEISYSLGYNVKEELLDLGIFLELPINRVKTQIQIAEEITKLIKPVLRDLNERDRYKDVIRKLYLWMNKNRIVAEEIFSEIYEKRFLLVSDDEIASNLEKAEILDEILLETGLSHDKLREILNNPNLFKILTGKESEVQSQDAGLYPAGSEEDILISPSMLDVSSEKSRISVSEEAKEIIFETLRNRSFIIPETIKINFTIVDGIISPTGKKIKLVVKSAKAGKIYFNPSEWLALTEADSQLFVVTRGNVVRNITLGDIESVNDIFHMRFNTKAFATSNLKAFANFFRYLPYTHFIFDTPESTTDYLNEFGLNQRNPSSSELTADDKNLLH